MERLPGESDKAWLAFTCYCGLGLNRSMLAAQRLYDEKTGKKADLGGKKRTNGSFDGWAKTYNWEERVREWDTAQENRRRERLMGAENEKFLSDIEAFRQTITDIGNGALATAKAAMNIAQGQVEMLQQATADSKPLNPQQLEDLTTLLKCSRDTVAVLEGGKSALNDAYGLNAVIDLVELEFKKTKEIDR
jgi:hypothetical protein